jgi:hypothetical protein
MLSFIQYGVMKIESCECGCKSIGPCHNCGSPYTSGVYWKPLVWSE